MNKINTQIIVIDDNIEVHHYILNFFKRKGFQIKSYFNAKSALKDFSSGNINGDILLTDYHFTDMTKEEFQASLSEILQSIPTFHLTSYNLKATTITIDRVENGQTIKKSIPFKDLYLSILGCINSSPIVPIDSMQSLQGLEKVFDSQINLIGNSSSFLKAIDLAKKVALSPSTILIAGESGTGKEVFANFIHAKSYRKGKFVAINCSSIPENLLESELFGHAKGSFTGAIDKKIGLFETAENGTIFLDEIGDLSFALQAKLLRVLQEKKIKRVGENKDIAINCRIISATHKNLAEEVEADRFREDLYYRINVITLKIPPLRERRDDILLLAESFLKRFTQENQIDKRFFSEDAKQWLINRYWRGNVRELENSIERAVVLSDKEEVSKEDIAPFSEDELRSEDSLSNEKSLAFCVEYNGYLPSLEYIKNQYISYAIQMNHGARDKTAKDIGIDRKTLYKREHEDLTDLNSKIYRLTNG